MKRCGAPRWLLCAVLAGFAGAAAADGACMVSPTSKEQVSGRFGKFREGDPFNFGSGNPKPHMHDGLDFSTGGIAAPLFASTDGEVIYAKWRSGQTGNQVLIKRADGSIAAYYHLTLIDPSVQVGAKVTAGQQIGLSGNTGAKDVHLHFAYGIPKADDVRSKSFSSKSNLNPAFNPAQLPSSINNDGFGYATDPSPYFCKSFPIQHDGLEPILGADTKAQFSALFGGTAPSMGVSSAATEFSSAQVQAANSDVLQAAAHGATGNIASVLADGDGYGALPPAPLGGFDTNSPLAMMEAEGLRRFVDSQWTTDIVKVGQRGLWVDYLRAAGVSAYMRQQIALKRQHVEALLAVYTSRRLAAVKSSTAATQRRTLQSDVTKAIQ